MWLISRTCACVVILGASIGLSLLFGHSQPVSPQIRAWRLDECVGPCWMGIIPGRSTIPEAYTQVAALLKTLGYTLDPLSGPWDGLGIFLGIRNSTGHKDPNAII